MTDDNADSPKIDPVRLMALQRAFDLFARTVKTSDPNEIVRYAAAFERYLRDGA